MIHIIGTTIKITVEFKDNDTGTLADVSELKYRAYLDSETPLGEEVNLTPAECRESLGTYSFNYQIPNISNKKIVLKITGVIAGIIKVTTATIDVDWREDG